MPGVKFRSGVDVKKGLPRPGRAVTKLYSLVVKLGSHLVCEVAVMGRMGWEVFVSDRFS